MAYTQSYAASARRHLQAADELDDGHRRDVAGYLYGVAAECALKELMRASGMRPLAEALRREDPFYAHFPKIKAQVSARVSGRNAGKLRQYVEDDSFLNEWDTDMRYAPSSEISHKQVDRWRDQAKGIVRDMEGLR